MENRNDRINEELKEEINEEDINSSIKRHIKEGNELKRKIIDLIEEQNEELRSQNKKITELIEEANYKIRFMKMKQVIEEEYDSEETTSTIQEERTEEVSINRR
ncbi:hypothetical protein RCL_jg28044.t1 [Rhizophagus clarus]|uniref:Uncharacterized protein n=1 Tax=Rhizophagus clarus TaxID=94130 RepID=A0A8H3LZA1_9GLOM|nr:hypothetical protein RCL_jg28044.t1 [Rhizophagus clarus]